MSSLPKNVKVQWFPVLVFSALFICFFTACHLYYANQYDRIRATIHEELSSIADLKVQQISNWRQERIRDIQLFASNPSFAEYVRPGENVQLKKEILSLMRSALKLHGYQNLMIADTQGSPRLSAIEESWTPPDPALIQKALTGGRPVLGDLTRAAGSDSIYLDIVAPLLQSDGSSAPAGLMVVRIDPHQFLYPYIQTWPSPSPSAETLLLRREGDTIIYLNELRHRKNTALSLRESIQDKELPAARILRGETGVEEMIDYRGAPVLAAARPVPDTPWCMVAKVDTQEIFEPLRRQALTATLVLGLLVLGAALFVWGLGGRRRSEELLRASHMQAELRAEQEKMLAAFKSIDDGIYIINRQYRLEYINPAMEIRFGPIDGRTCYQYFNGLDHACPWCRQEAVLADGTARWEWYHKKFQRHFDTMATPIENPDGSISVLHILRDVTGTKQSAEALQESEDKFRCCVEQSHDGIVLCDTEGKVVEWNRELERITQLPHDEAIGKYIWDVNYAVMPDETKSAAVHQKHKEMVQGIFSTGDNLLDIQPFEMFFQRPDGERTHVQNILFPIKTRNAFMWGGICRDITEKKQTNDALLASEARLKSSQQLAHLGDWEFNVTTGEIYWSDELYRLLEYSPGEIAPSFKSGIKSVHPDDRRTMLHAAAYRGTDPRKDEYRMVLRNGSLRYIYSEIWVVADSAGKPVLARGILQDITLHKMIEKELSRHHDKLDELVMVRTAKLEEEMLERMKTEKELRESEAQFRALAETSPDAVVMTDLYMNILYWNTAAEKIFGFSRQEMLGRQPDCLMVPAARERQAAAIKDIVATGHSPFLNGFTETVALKKRRQ